MNHDLLLKTLHNAREKLLQKREPAGHWQGKLSSSALATAVAMQALNSFDAVRYQSQIQKAGQWLLDHQNTDGGWGDSTLSPSNLSTTVLCTAALSAQNKTPDNAKDWLHKHIGCRELHEAAKHIQSYYGRDQTFAAPILSMLAAANQIPWKHVPPLPFELAVLPFSLYKYLHLQVVSYALPALIAVGQSKFKNCPPFNPLTKTIRKHSLKKTLNILQNIQPEHGGFLDAIPLTAFVTINLIAAGQKNHPIVHKCIDFLKQTVRPDGSWPIDTSLSTWLTTLSINALGDLPDNHQTLANWLLQQQFQHEHPYTHTAPGGWGWNDQPGAVPDADDTAGALLALKKLFGNQKTLPPAVEKGIQWLLNLQNHDGGVPTFCKGWSRLPFDRSCPDITAHALLAMNKWHQVSPDYIKTQIQAFTQKSLHYLKQSQTKSGAWAGLWFGNAGTLDQQNRTYGTARVLAALQALVKQEDTISALIHGGVDSLLASQNSDGGWGGGQKDQTASSIEETALAVGALAAYPVHRQEVMRGVEWLIGRTDGGRVFEASAMGLYFAKLWYSEALYPVIFTVEAMEKSAAFFE